MPIEHPLDRLPLLKKYFPEGRARILPALRHLVLKIHLHLQLTVEMLDPAIHDLPVTLNHIFEPLFAGQTVVPLDFSHLGRVPRRVGCPYAPLNVHVPFLQGYVSFAFLPDYLLFVLDALVRIRLCSVLRRTTSAHNSHN